MPTPPELSVKVDNLKVLVVMVEVTEAVVAAVLHQKLQPAEAEEAALAVAVKAETDGVPELVLRQQTEVAEQPDITEV